MSDPKLGMETKQMINTKPETDKYIALDPRLDNQGLKIPRKQDTKIYQVPEYEIELCENWIKAHCKERKTINRKAYSYSLKHAVERWSRRNDGPGYVSNAAFIQAALTLGYSCENSSLPETQPGANAFFNMSLPRRRTDLYRVAFPEGY